MPEYYAGRGLTDHLSLYPLLRSSRQIGCELSLLQRGRPAPGRGLAVFKGPLHIARFFLFRTYQAPPSTASKRISIAAATWFAAVSLSVYTRTRRRPGAVWDTTMSRKSESSRSKLMRREALETSIAAMFRSF